MHLDTYEYHNIEVTNVYAKNPTTLMEYSILM